MEKGSEITFTPFEDYQISAIFAKILLDEAIIELASLMKQSFEDSLLDEMIVWIADARLKACNLRMHDYTRKEMVKLLEDMLKSLDSIIEAANKNTRNFQD